MEFMDPEPIVFDISSDEESYGRMGDPKGDDFAWFAECLRVSGDGDKPSDDDSDDVVVLREIKAPSKSKSSKRALTDENDDDDDCVVLDGDPDKPVVDDSDSKDDSDELLIVAEKGQIACRDFPHSRHLCVRFPFATTPHEKHCDLCHCYVCDKPSPCAHWENTSFNLGHCHATDKENSWNAMRNNLKSGKIASPIPLLKLSETLMPGGLPQINQVASLNVVRLSPDSRPQNHVPRPSTAQACSSTNFCHPPILNRNRSPQFRSSFPRNRFQPRIVAGEQHLVDINNIRRDKVSQPVGNSGHRLDPLNPPVFKRPGILRVPRPAGSVGGVSLPMNQLSYNSPSIRNCAFPGQYPRNSTPAPALNNLNTMRWENANPCTHQWPSGPSLVAATLRSQPSQQQVLSQPVPAVSQSIPPLDSQSFYLPENLFHCSGQSIYPCVNETPHSVQNLGLEEVQNPGASSTSSVGYDPSWVSNALNNASQSSHQQQPLADHFQPQVVEPSNHPLPKESNPQFSIRNNNHSAEYELESWLLEEPSFPVVPDGSPILQSNNIYYPEAAFFDFETP